MANNSLMGYTWRPRCIEDTVDAGVHPVVAAMRLAQKGTKEGSGVIVGGMDLKAAPWKSKEGPEAGYTYQKRNGPASAVAATHPTKQIDRLASMGMNPQDFFKLAKSAGLNPVQSLLTSKSGADLPRKGAKEKKKKKKKKAKKEKKKAKKKAKIKDKKKSKEEKKKASKGKKQKKQKSSSSSSSSSSSEEASSSKSSGSAGSRSSASDGSGGERKRRRSDASAHEEQEEEGGGGATAAAAAAASPKPARRSSSPSRDRSQGEAESRQEQPTDEAGYQDF